MAPPFPIFLFVIASIIFAVISSIALIALIWRTISAFCKRKPLPFLSVLIAIAIVVGTFTVTCWLLIFSRWVLFGLIHGEPEYVLTFLLIASSIGIFVWIAWINIWLSRFRPPDRPWVQFSLRKLIAITLFIAVCGGLFGMKIREAKRQRKVIEQLTELGAKMGLGGKIDSSLDPYLPESFNTSQLDSIDRMSIHDTQLRDLSSLSEFKNLEQLTLNGMQVNNLPPLAKLERLQIVCFYGAQVSDLSSVQDLKQLKSLSIGGAQVSDLSPLTELKGLKSLRLESSMLSDLSPLAALNDLETLSLSGEKVRDLSPLRQLTNLRFLDLSRTQVSDAEIEKLKSSLPGLFVECPSARKIVPDANAPK